MVTIDFGGIIIIITVQSLKGDHNDSLTKGISNIKLAVYYFNLIERSIFLIFFQIQKTNANINKEGRT